MIFWNLRKTCFRDRLWQLEWKTPMGEPCLSSFSLSFSLSSSGRRSFRSFRSFRSLRSLRSFRSFRSWLHGKLSAICKTLGGWQGIIAVGYGSNAGFPQDVMIYYTRHDGNYGLQIWDQWNIMKHPTFCRLWSYGSYEAVKTGVALVVASDLNWSWQAAGKWKKKEDQCHGCHHATLGRNVCSSPDGGSCHHFSTALWLWCVFQNRSKPRTVTSEIQESDGSKKMIQTTIGGFNDVICYNHPIPEILHNF